MLILSRAPLKTCLFREYEFLNRKYSLPLIRFVGTRPLDFSHIDPKWQTRWNQFEQWTLPEASRGKYYVLPMFPYPSGTLHVGHLRNYTISDIIARYRRMSGYDVLHPIGWDAFGLPAENAAIERGIDPSEWTLSNIRSMKKQIETMGGCWDWDKEIMTCDPEFFKGTQGLFLKLFEHGFVYQNEAIVNYDPVDRTVLANEQVDASGFSWRSGAKVEKRKLKQWFIKITKFAPQLLEDLKLLEKDAKWPARVVSMQRNWLGKSEGASLSFQIFNSSQESTLKIVKVFTTRPDTLFGVQYLALATDHSIVQDLASSSHEIQTFIDKACDTEPDSKAGLLLSTLRAQSPLEAITNDDERMEDIPVFVAPYVRSEYASGAVMGVPAHDARDYAFWQHNRPDPMVEARAVVLPDSHQIEEAPTGPQPPNRMPYTEHGILSDNCKQFSGLASRDAGQRIVENLRAASPDLARFETNWRLKDWLISRQRYWGTPIPIVHCKLCGAVPVPKHQLPVELPKLTKGRIASKGADHLQKDSEWRQTACPKCGANAERETDTMDTFVDSSWYYLNFAQAAARTSSNISYMPVDLYIGGVEHAILHLLYARFISKFLAEISSSKEPSNEPFSRLITQGMVHGRTYRNASNGQYLKPDQVDISNPQAPRVLSTGELAVVSFEKMSKSKHNGVNPTECMQKYGADVTRAHMLFQAPVSEILEWDEDKIVGVQRWFGRIWQLAHDLASSGGVSTGLEPVVDVQVLSDPEAELWKEVQSTIVSVQQSLSETYTLNTVVSDLMTLTNKLVQHNLTTSDLPLSTRKILHHSCNILLRLLTPIAPSFSEECWSILHNHDVTEPKAFDVTKTASCTGFPQVDGSLEKLASRSQLCAVQINGKVRFVTSIAVPPEELEGGSLQAWILERALRSEEAKMILEKGKWDVQKAKRVVVVKRGRTVNLVI